MPRPLPPISPSPLRRVRLPWTEAADIALWLKRDDLLHPHISGNKWRKLAPNLEAAVAAGHHRLLTFGGAYSNHLAAVAAAGRLLGFETVGIVRGERIEPLNPTLAFAERQGMQLHFLSRSEFRLRKKPDAWPEWQARFGPCCILPEGGSNDLAVRGCTAIAREVEATGLRPDWWVVAAGT
ncbi:MAG: pyridoxal-phosphate dependent enzyme, partial [Alphaproteobacteria bacterium]